MPKKQVEMIEREFECIICRTRLVASVRKGTRPYQQFRCKTCNKGVGHFATDFFKRIDENGST